MTAAEEQYDHSKPSARFIVLMGLLTAGGDAGLLSFEALRTSPVSVVYAVALATAAVATLMFARRQSEAAAAGDQAGNTPQTGPVWHESTVFTDPWYQLPAVFCVFVLFSRFVLDLVAQPPASERAVWFLAGLGIATLAVAFGLTGKADPRKGTKSTGTADEPTKPDQPNSPVGATLRDPWFNLPASSIVFLHIARAGLEEIEEDPQSIFATVWLFMPAAILVVGLVIGAVARNRRRRKAGSHEVAVP